MGICATVKPKHSLELPCDFGTYSPPALCLDLYEQSLNWEVVFTFLLKYNTLPGLIFRHLMSLGLVWAVTGWCLGCA